MSTYVLKPTWDEYYAGIAEAASKRSSCVRSKVGACVVKNNRVVALGYNDAPAGKPGCTSCPRRTSGVVPGAPYDGSGSGRCVAVHAEANALLYCDREDLVGATLYITREPCDWCSKLIEAAGVERVVWPEYDLEQLRDGHGNVLRTRKTQEIVEDWHGKCKQYD